MDKKKLLLNFGEEDKNDALNLYEKYELAYKKDIVVFSNGFYTPNIWTFFKRNFKHEDFKIEDNGFFEEAERRMVSFNNNYGTSFPYKVIQVKNTSKFNNLSHRDYLGAVLSLGIKRNKLGDLLVKEDCCYFPVSEDIADFILTNLKNIGRVSCIVNIVEDTIKIPNAEFKEEIILIQSLRVDSVVSKLAKISRGKAQTLIEEGKVLLDYNVTREKSMDIAEDCRITIRGIGKFIISKTIGNSKSGKIKILIKKYT